jgi:hypothetical protein
MKHRKNRMRIINRLRRRSLLIIRTYQLMQDQATVENKRIFKKTMRIIRKIDFST